MNELKPSNNQSFNNDSVEETNQIIQVKNILEKRTVDPIRTNMIPTDHGNVGCMYSLALHYKDKKDDENMLKYLKMASDNGFDKATEMLAIHYEENKEYIEEIKCLEALYSTGNINYADYPFIIGQLYEFLRNFDGMVKYYDICVSTKINSTDARKAIIKLINYFSSKEHYDLDYLIKYLKINADDFSCGKSAYRIGQIFEKKHKYELAKKYYKDSYLYEKDDMPEVEYMFGARYRAIKRYYKYGHHRRNSAYNSLIRIEKIIAKTNKKVGTESSICHMCTIS